MKPSKTLIESISQSFRDYFENGLKFIRKGNTYIIEGTENTINRFDVPPEEVKAKKWFDDIWFFIKIKPLSDENCNHYSNISISFFIETSPHCLNQLFRAEWDNYKISENQHPQPHWHITSSLPLEKSFDELIDDTGNTEDSFNIFAELFKDENKNILGLHKMHFAMTGQWHENGIFVNKISEIDQIINWMKYLFSHVRSEIEYMKKKG